MFPDTFAGNIKRHKEALCNAGSKSLLCYALKVNKAPIFVRECAKAGIGADVSSLEELDIALEAGISGSRILVSGAYKSKPLVKKAASCMATISLDSPSEISFIKEVLKSVDCTSLDVLIRLSGPKNARSRFGFVEKDVPSAVNACLNGPLRLRGFHFHLFSPDSSSRTKMILNCLGYIKRWRSEHSHMDTIDIGGGFPCSYLPEATWSDFKNLSDQEKAGLYHERRVASEYYEHWTRCPGHLFLSKILERGDGQPSSLCDTLRTNGIRVIAEPGRSLLDQAGVSVFQVNGVKQCSDREPIVVVDGNSLSFCSRWFGMDFLVDPYLIPQTSDSDEVVLRAHVMGSTCSQTDAFSWRRIEFPQTPKHGDLLLYANTAAYEMDFIESNLHQQASPPRVVIRNNQIEES